MSIFMGATPFNKLVEGDTRSGPLGTGEEGRVAGQEYANARNLEEEANANANRGGGGGGGDGAGTTAAAWAAEAAWPSAAEVEDVEVEVSCWGCPPAPKKAKKDGDGSSKDQALARSNATFWQPALCLSSTLCK